MEHFHANICYQSHLFTAAVSPGRQLKPSKFGDKTPAGLERAMKGRRNFGAVLIGYEGKMKYEKETASLVGCLHRNEYNFIRHEAILVISRFSSSVVFCEGSSSSGMLNAYH